MTKISHTQITKYKTCGKEYDFYYNKKIRSNKIHSALLFGKALDVGLNELLITRDLEEAKIKFSQSLYKDAEANNTIIFSDKDFDLELVEHFNKLPETTGEVDYKDFISSIQSKQKNNIPIKKEDLDLFKQLNIASLESKGLVMLDSYTKEILPRITEVYAVQKQIKLENEDGDEVTGFLDAIVKINNKITLLDHKSSATEYTIDDVNSSQQLITYNHEAKEQYGIEEVGFGVFLKSINKNKVKVCKVCGNDGSGGRHKTCDKEVDSIRCNGSWDIKLNPTATIQLLTSTVSETAETLVLEAIDSANEGIKAGKFEPNLTSCKRFGRKCDYYDLCWKNKMDGLYEDK